jgi:hypothetical protein
VTPDLRKEGPPRGGAFLAGLAFVAGAVRLLGGPGTPLWSRFLAKSLRAEAASRPPGSRGSGEATGAARARRLPAAARAGRLSRAASRRPGEGGELLLCALGSARRAAQPGRLRAHTLKDLETTPTGPASVLVQWHGRSLLAADRAPESRRLIYQGKAAPVGESTWRTGASRRVRGGRPGHLR